MFYQEISKIIIIQQRLRERLVKPVKVINIPKALLHGIKV